MLGKILIVTLKEGKGLMPIMVTEDYITYDDMVMYYKEQQFGGSLVSFDKSTKECFSDFLVENGIKGGMDDVESIHLALDLNPSAVDNMMDCEDVYVYRNTLKAKENMRKRLAFLTREGMTHCEVTIKWGCDGEEEECNKVKLVPSDTDTETDPEDGDIFCYVSSWDELEQFLGPQETDWELMAITDWWKNGED